MNNWGFRLVFACIMWAICAVMSGASTMHWWPRLFTLACAYVMLYTAIFEWHAYAGLGRVSQIAVIFVTVLPVVIASYFVTLAFIS